MPRPVTTPPTWATDANFTATDPADAHDGTPTRVEPSVSQKANGFEPKYRVPAQFLNWLFGLFSDWLVYLASFTNTDDEIVYPAAKTRRITIGLHSGQPIGAGSWSPPSPGESADYKWTSDAGGQEQIVFDLNPYLRHGQTIVNARMLAKPGSDPGGGNRMRFGIYRSADLDFTGADAPVAPTLICTQELAGAVRATATATPGGTVIVVRTTQDQSRDYFLLVTSTNALVNDELYGLEIQVSETLLRNS